jgi:hypothetical protein
MKSKSLPINRCAASRGLGWWAGSFKMLKAAPARWYLTGVIYSVFFYAVVLEVLEWVTWLSVVAVPFFMVGVANTGRAQAHGERWRFAHLVGGLRSKLFRLLFIGVLASALLVAATRCFMGAMPYSEFSRLGLDALLAPVLFQPLGWMLFWLAPLVAASQGAGPMEAVWRSLGATLLNWRAAALYALVPFAGRALLMAARVLPEFFPIVEKASPALSLLYLLGLLLLPFLVVWVMLSAYVAYNDIFSAGGEPSKPPEKVV